MRNADEIRPVHLRMGLCFCIHFLENGRMRMQFFLRNRIGGLIWLDKCIRNYHYEVIEYAKWRGTEHFLLVSGNRIFIF